MYRKAYAIYDRTAGDILSGVITLHAHEAAAVRAFADVVLSPNSILARHPDDFVLLEMGAIETPTDPNAVSGPYWTLAEQSPRVIMSARSVLAAQSQEETRA